MSFRRGASTCVLLFLAGLLAPHEAESAETTSTSAERAERAEQARLKRALGEVVAREVASAGLGASLEPYSLSPALLQLRRYRQRERTELVCVVGLALEDRHGSLVAEVRGSAATSGQSALETLEAATRSAVARLPETISLAQKR
jgi:hypothetical protein